MPSPVELDLKHWTKVTPVEGRTQVLKCLSFACFYSSEVAPPELASEGTELAANSTVTLEGSPGYKWFIAKKAASTEEQKPSLLEVQPATVESIGSGELAEGSVTTTKIAASAVTAAKIGAAAVEAGQIKASAVTEAKIATNAVTAAKIKAEAAEATKVLVGVPAASVARAASSEFEAPAETTTVYLSIKGKAEATAYEVISDGKPVYTVAEETLVASSLDMTHMFRIKSKGKWEVKVTKGTLAEINSVYQAG